MVNITDLHCTNRAARIVTNISHDTSADALTQKLKWPNFTKMMKRGTATIVYKLLNGLAPQYPSNIFSKYSSRDTVKLRNSETDLRIPLPKTSNVQNYSHIVVSICGTALNLTLSKHPHSLSLSLGIMPITGVRGHGLPLSTISCSLQHVIHLHCIIFCHGC